jgi:hypothetical protein
VPKDTLGSINTGFLIVPVLVRGVLYICMATLGKKRSVYAARNCTKTITVDALTSSIGRFSCACVPRKIIYKKRYKS